MSGPESAGLLCWQSVGAPTGKRWGGLGLRCGRFPLALPPRSHSPGPWHGWSRAVAGLGQQ